MLDFYYTIFKAQFMIYAESSIKGIESNFNFKDENNVFAVNNEPISDELNPLPGDSTEISEHAKNHRNKTKLVDILSEDFTLVLTTSVATLAGAGILTGLLLVPVAPSMKYFNVTYKQNVATIDFELQNISGGETLLTVMEEETEEIIYTSKDLKNQVYSIPIEIEYDVTYKGKVVNTLNGSETIIKEFDLLINQ